MQRIDIVLFGATGFTGKFVAKELAKAYKFENFTWAVAGRSKSKLSELLNEIKTELGTNIDEIEIIIVDIIDSKSVYEMCQKAKVIINCVGPYRFFGETVIKECVKTGTHHIDVSGEPEFLERMQFNYNQAAKDANVLIVGSCGFDSVPADMGVVFTKKMFEGQLNHIESFLTMESNGADIKLNYATWESAVYGLGSSDQLGNLRKKLFKTRLPRSDYRPARKPNSFGYFYDNFIKKYCMLFFGSDKSVVQRSQYFCFDTLNEYPIQYHAYFTIPSYRYVSAFVFWGGLFTILAKFRFGRYLLLKYYKFFSRGLATKGEVTEKQIKNSTFKMTFMGEGWNSANLTEVHKKAPDSTIVTEVSGPEPGYVSTAKILMECALVILKEKENIPVNGGVLTPASAFAKTKLIDRLTRHGIKFDVVHPSAKSQL